MTFLIPKFTSFCIDLSLGGSDLRFGRIHFLITWYPTNVCERIAFALEREETAKIANTDQAAISS